MQNQQSVLDMARGYAVPDSPSHINVLACEVVRLFEELQRIADDPARALSLRERGIV